MPAEPDDSKTPPRSPAGSSKPPPRPREVTWAAWLIMAGSLVVVLTSFERISGLRSLEARKGVEDFLGEPPGQGLGLSVDEVLDIIQVMSMVAGGAAAATAILGYQVLQQSKSARRALVVLAVPLFIGGLSAGGFMGSLVAASVVWLYLQPARDWFDGIRRADEPRITPSPSGGPRSMVGFGRHPSASSPSDGSSVSEQASGTPSAKADPAPRQQLRVGRPSPLVWACSITWGFCGLAVLFLGGVILVLATIPEAFFDELRAQDPDFAGAGLSDGEIASASILTSSLLVLWCVISIVLAIFAFQRARWARIALLVSVSAAAAVCLVGALASAVLVLPLLLAVVTVVLLLRPQTVSWFLVDP